MKTKKKAIVSTWTEEDARQILDEWRSSGTTLAAFARRRGIVPQRLAWWRKRLGDRSGDERALAPAFVPLTVRPIEREAAPATVEVNDRLRLELRTLDGASAAWVASLWRALSGTP